jgi:acyl-CoA thioesterase FadM
VTAELTIKYKKPIMTPAVLLCRARVAKEAGRWVELVGWVEDGNGTVYAEGRGAFVKMKHGNGNGGASSQKDKSKI